MRASTCCVLSILVEPLQVHVHQPCSSSDPLSQCLESQAMLSKKQIGFTGTCVAMFSQLHDVSLMGLKFVHVLMSWYVLHCY